MTEGARQDESSTKRAIKLFTAVLLCVPTLDNADCKKLLKHT